MNLRHICLVFILSGIISPLWGKSEKCQKTKDSAINIIRIPDTAKSGTLPLHLKPKLISKLPGSIKETSGLVFFRQMLWTLNDGGNPAELYQIDTAKGSIIKIKRLSNITNIDWEGITQDSLNIYIGDFGNNSGSRIDLRILKISKSDLINTTSDSIYAGIININYPDQLNFDATVQKTEYDCEAFFFHNDSLHLFTKNWSNQTTRHYSVSADTGKHELIYIESFAADGLITDASVNEQGNIILLGYKNTGGKFWNCFCWLFTDYNSNSYFNGEKTRIELGSVLHIGQAEAIIFKNDNTAWISSESIRVGFLPFRAKLMKLNLNPLFLQIKIKTHFH
jgi:hypothetical protein